MDSLTTSDGRSCQSVHSNLTTCSHKCVIPARALVLSWCLRHMGFIATLRMVGSKIRRMCRRGGDGKTTAGRKTSASDDSETLNLQPGDLVQVKSEEEIRVTLDEHGRHRGLLWMPGMARFCGKRCTVFKRVETIMLESTGELRKLRNTVSLTNVMCENLYGCDRSCFHYWREVWLRRVP